MGRPKCDQGVCGSLYAPRYAGYRVGAKGDFREGGLAQRTGCFPWADPIPRVPPLFPGTGPLRAPSSVFFVFFFLLLSFPGLGPLRVRGQLRFTVSFFFSFFFFVIVFPFLFFFLFIFSVFFFVFRIFYFLFLSSILNKYLCCGKNK